MDTTPTEQDLCRCGHERRDHKEGHWECYSRDTDYMDFASTRGPMRGRCTCGFFYAEGER